MADVNGRRWFAGEVVAAAVMLALFAAAAGTAVTGRAGTAVAVGWVGDLGLDLRFVADAFALTLVGLVGLVGVAVVCFSARTEPGPTRRRLALLLPAFALAMAGLVLADDLVALVVFWEATSVLSFLLVGGDGRDATARRAARQALAVTGAGGLALLAGVIVVGVTTGTTSLTALAADGTTVDGAAAVLLLLGAATKSAQFPFHGWLPGAMAAPTPVSAYLHSATMVKAGIVLVARLLPVLSSSALVLLAVLGATTTLWGGTAALRQRDLKRLLAYSTVSQLGLMVLVLSIGTAKALLAATALLLAHALAKAGLFLSMGAAKLAAGTRDLDALRGLARQRPALGLAFTAGFASLAGIPPAAGFVAKEAAVVGAVGVASPLVVATIVASAVLTTTYAVRTLNLLWARPAAAGRGRPLDRTVLAPPLVLAGLAVSLGILTPVLDGVAGSAAGAILPASATATLVLWPGIGTPLALSLGALVLGATLGAALPLPSRTGGRDAADAIERVLDGIGVLAGLVAAGTRRYSRVYTLGTIVLAASLGVLWSLRGAALVGGRPDAGVLPAALAIAVAAAALATALARQRIAAALALGAVGFSMAGLFVALGAPDLALTQLLVEFVVVVAFVLVFRRMPGRFAAGARLPRSGRAALSVLLGASVSGLLLAATSSRVSAPATADLVDAAVGPGAGSNVVNVILTDIRALDTLGEVTVVAVAALGVLALARRRGSA